VFGLPGDEKNQPHASADGGVGDVERGKINDASAALLQVKIEKIHDGMTTRQQAVDEIAGDAAKNQAEGNLAGERMRIERDNEWCFFGKKGDGFRAAVI
jgi:hypothetical protein